jgi:hypothetical protein
VETHHTFDRRLYALGTFCLLFALGTTFSVRGDPQWRLLITRQIIFEGSLHTQEPQTRLVQTPKGWTSYSAIGQTLLFIPFEAAGVILSRSGLPIRQDMPFTYFYCPMIGVAYLLSLCALLEAFGLPARTAAKASLIFTFCSLSAFYVAHSHQEEPLAGILLCLSLRAALLWRRSSEMRYAFQAGLFGAAIILFRYNGVLALLPVAAVFAHGLYERGLRSLPKVIGAGLLGASGPAGVHLTFAYLRFGNALFTGYEFLRPGWEVQVPAGAGAEFYVSMALYLLFGPGKGFFVYSPLLIIALWGLWVKRSTLATYSAACFAALLLGVIVALRTIPIAHDGCWSWGARYQVHLLPLFAYPAWVGVQALLARPLRVVVMAVLAFGLLAQISGMLGSERVEYLEIAPHHDDVGLCLAVQKHQFGMRVGNIAKAIGLTDSGATDDILKREFVMFSALYNARSFSGWARSVVIFVWVGLFAVAAACLLPIFRSAPVLPGKAPEHLER